MEGVAGSVQLASRKGRVLPLHSRSRKENSNQATCTLARHSNKHFSATHADSHHGARIKTRTPSPTRGALAACKLEPVRATKQRVGGLLSFQVFHRPEWHNHSQRQAQNNTMMLFLSLGWHCGFHARLCGEDKSRLVVVQRWPTTTDEQQPTRPTTTHAK